VASDSHLEGKALILGVHQTGSTPAALGRQTIGLVGHNVSVAHRHK
jgi:hypothetical protein